ncbi:hypothetical protein GY45DRAFT_57126 [Cubamyces sp. BRFM 1775]|nr:hypothetical protein GY45DRAFT_57126 [Cubamyces sp. BRFM 1775]
MAGCACVACQLQGGCESWDVDLTGWDSSYRKWSLQKSGGFTGCSIADGRAFDGVEGQSANTHGLKTDGSCEKWGGEKRGGFEAAVETISACILCQIRVCDRMDGSRWT